MLDLPRCIPIRFVHRHVGHAVRRAIRHHLGVSHAAAHAVMGAAKVTVVATVACSLIVLPEAPTTEAPAMGVSVALTGGSNTDAALWSQAFSTDWILDCNCTQENIPTWR